MTFSYVLHSKLHFKTLESIQTITMNLCFCHNRVAFRNSWVQMVNNGKELII